MSLHQRNEKKMVVQTPGLGAKLLGTFYSQIYLPPSHALDTPLVDAHRTTEISWQLLPPFARTPCWNPAKALHGLMPCFLWHPDILSTELLGLEIQATWLLLWGEVAQMPGKRFSGPFQAARLLSRLYCPFPCRGLWILDSCLPLPQVSHIL